MTGPTDDELAALTLRIRRHRRRALLAKACGVAVAFASLAVGLAIAWFILPTLSGGRLFWVFAVVGGIAGAFVYKRLEPKDDPADE